SAAESAFAIRQVEAPQVAETPVEAGRKAALRLGLVEALAPGRERRGIVEPEVLLVGPCQASGFGEATELARLDQQPPREDVSLDEVGVAGIGFEQVVAHGD